MQRILEAIHSPKKGNENNIPATVKTENYEDDEQEITASDIMLQQPEEEDACLSSKSPISEAHYDNDESVTIVYPPPLLSTNEELVNLVHLPNEVDSDIHLEASDLHYEGNVVLQQEFESSNHIAVITTDTPDGQLELLESESTDTIAYFETDPEASTGRTDVTTHSLLSDQLIHIPTSDSEGNSQTLAVPLSVVNESFISSLKLGAIPFAVSGDISETLTIPVSIQASNLVPVSHSDSQGYIITDLSVKEEDESIKPNELRPRDKFPFKKRAKQGQVGRPPRIQPSKKLLGSGPMAISAQGVVQEINNRLVTVLPRPEDLKKLMENKQLILPIKGSNSNRASYLKQKEKEFYQDGLDESLPLEVRMEESIGAEDIVLEMTMPNGEQTSAIIIEGKIAQKTNSNYPKLDHPKIKKKRGRKRGRARGSYVVSSMGRRPGRLHKVQTLIQGLKGPRVIHTGPPNSMLPPEQDIGLDYSKKNMDEAQVDDISETRQKDDFADNPWDNLEGVAAIEEESNPSKRKLPPRKRGTRYKMLLQALMQDEDDDENEFYDGEDFSPDFSINPKAQPVPIKPKGTSGPGKRGRPRKETFHFDPPNIEGDGTRIIQLSESLRPIITASSPSILIKEGRNAPLSQANGPEQHHRLVITFEQPDTGEMVVQHIAVQPHKDKPAMHSSLSLENYPKTNISLIEQPDDVSDEDAATIFVSENGEYEKGYECDQCDKILFFKRDYIRHLRQAHDIRPYECDQCRKTFTSKTSLQDHKLIHNLEKPYRCNNCGLGFFSSHLLKLHMDTHSDRQFKCEECGKTFSNSLQLKKHLFSDEDLFEYFRCKECSAIFNCLGLLEEHSCSVNKHYGCDICQLHFTSTSGLNRHRKVHKRTKDGSVDSMETEWKCTTCHANFSYKESLLKHVQKFHWVSFDLEKDESPSQFSDDENSIIEQLQQKLNEGYAPKTSELYDVPEENETLEKNLKDPFFCGICNSSFIDVEILCDHYTSCHTGEQKFYCEACMVGCSTEKQLELHKAIHIEEEQKSLIPVTGSLPLMCGFCGKSFKKNTDLEKHRKTHSQDRPFKCPYCESAFGIKSALDKHLMVHTGQRPYRCDICLKTFRQSAALVRHKLWTHRLKNQNKCDICSKTFFTRDLLLFHLDTHGADGEISKENLLSKAGDAIQKEREGSQWNDEQDEDLKKRTCEYCGKEFSSFVALLTHKISHKLSASFKCDLCHRTFREKRYLKKHRLTHKGHKSWTCDICRKSFTTKLTLIRHAHVHLREALRPSVSANEENGWNTSCTLPLVLKCDRCNLEFSHKSHFVRHKLLHSGIPLLKCGLCSRMFVHKSDMIRHKVMHSFMFTCDICGRNFHKRPLYILHRKRHFDDKPFKCDKCSKSFSTSGNYTIHKRIHSGEKPYWCDICDYKCSQSGRLVKHKRMHAGIKPYSCELCEKQFVTPESVRVHQRVHTGERPFRCPHCLKSFINSNSLNHHLRDHVKEETLKCDQCPHKFKRQEHYDKHQQFHDLQQRYQENANLKMHPTFASNLYMCDVCGRVFDKKKYLYTHHNVHSRMRLFTCSYCNKDLASRMALKNHMLIHTGMMPHKCCFCEKEFRSLSNLKRHEKVHCNQEVFGCDECGETFYSKELLDEHKQEHVNFMMINSEVETVNNSVNQQLYVFDSVEDGITEAMDSTQQLLVENSQQQFLVDGAQSLLVFQGGTTETYASEISEPEPPVNEPHEEEEKVSDEDIPSDHALEEENPPTSIIFDTKLIEASAIAAEERTLDKPHQCDVCSKTFAKKQYLTKHKYRHREVKPHSCDVCGKRFAQKFEVAVHKIKHTGERPYQCEVCKKEFRSKVNLANHKMRHTGEYPYLCSVCHKGLSTQLQLEKHVLMHTGSLQYPCQYCSKNFSQRLSLERHLSRIHNFETYKTSANSDESLQMNKPIYHMDSLEAQMPEGKQTIVATLVGNHPIKVEEEDEDDGIITATVEDMDMSTIDGGREDHLSIFPVQQEYLKSCLLGAPTDTEEAKFLESILHSRSDVSSGVVISDTHVEVDSDA